MRILLAVLSATLLTSSMSAPSRAARAAARVANVSPSDTTCESTTSTRAPRSARTCAAWRALLWVAESLAERWTETISFVSLSSGSYTSRKSPTEGADVLGSTLPWISLS